MPTTTTTTARPKHGRAAGEAPIWGADVLCQGRSVGHQLRKIAPNLVQRAFDRFVIVPEDDDTVLLVGGQGNVWYNFSMNIRTYQLARRKTTGVAPAVCRGHSALRFDYTTEAGRCSEVVVFGGWVSRSSVKSAAYPRHDVNHLELGRNVWTHPPRSRHAVMPAQRSCHAYVKYSDTEMLIHGGADVNNADIQFSDMFIYDVPSRTFHAVTMQSNQAEVGSFAPHHDLPEARHLRDNTLPTDTPLAIAQHSITLYGGMLFSFGGVIRENGADKRQSRVWCCPVLGNAADGYHAGYWREVARPCPFWRPFSTPAKIRAPRAAYSHCRRGDLVYFYGGEGVAKGEAFPSPKMVVFDLHSREWGAMPLGADPAVAGHSMALVGGGGGGGSEMVVMVSPPHFGAWVQEADALLGPAGMCSDANFCHFPKSQRAAARLLLLQENRKGAGERVLTPDLARMVLRFFMCAFPQRRG